MNIGALRDRFPLGNLQVVSTMPRRDQVAVAVFGTWMIIGLFIDGWAHENDKPETFFSPWHGVLYSGFAAAILFFFLVGQLERRSGIRQRMELLTLAGFLLFGAGGSADFFWHTVFGIEANLEALLSPTHLMLMTGGLLMLTGPIRSVYNSSERSPSFRQFAPTLVTITLATALVSFFLLYLSAFHVVTRSYQVYAISSNVDFLAQAHGIASILVSNALLLGPVFFILRRWHPPAGTFTAMFTGVALLMSGLDGFSEVPLVAAASAGGLTADLLTRRLAPDNLGWTRVAAILTPMVLWSVWFAIFAAAYGLGWPPELWIGTTVFTMLTGLGLSLIAFPPATSRR